MHTAVYSVVKGRKILVGVCGSIAAYKSALLVRLLVQAGAEVQVVLTPSATAFVTPLTLGTLSKNPVLQGFVKDERAGEWHNHVHLGLWADALVVAPASANSLAHFAHGLCNTLLDAVYLSARCPVFVAPAMDLDMYQHPATQHNLQLLRAYGNTVWDSPAGELASGLSGPGRMLEPEDIVRELERFFEVGIEK
ncbi:flavoprotein [Hymenobacter metallilatus]|uniref:flavoprotein n=1 Tax=Hymenobacter metallilatus TaxID=2493666 RepID=UPI0037432851